MPYKKVVLTRKNILRRDAYRCGYCGRGDLRLTIDHIIPKARGGTDSWDEQGLPVERATSVISLERQVRITAGTLIFLGTLLGVFVNRYFLIIPGFVGAGLVFAGVTDTCGMGLLLARMPWNR